MAITQIDGARQIKAGTITNTQQNFGTPVTANDVATKSYVDSIAQGLDPKPSAVVATTTVLPTVIYANGSSGVGATLTASANGILTVDGVAQVINNYVLIKNQAAGLQNGLYKMTTEGTAGVPFVLTRAVEMDSTLEYSGGYIFIEQGTVNGATGWTCTNSTAPTVGTTSIVFTQFSGAGTYTSGTGITIIGTSVAIDTSVTADLTTAQTLTNKTLTSPKINENVALTTTATKLNLLTSATGTTGTTSTNLVFSTSPTLVTPVLGVASATSLATSAATPLLMTNGQLVNVALTSQTVGATTLTIPDFAGVVDEFTFKTKAQTLSNKTFVTPILGVATATSINGNTISTGTGTLTLNTKTLNVSNTLTLAGTDSTTMTFPTTSATIARTDAGNTFTGVNNFTSPDITTSITTSSTSFTAFAGATTLLTIGGTGASASLFAPSTLDASSSTTGAIRTSGGISAAKSANIGTSLVVGSFINEAKGADIASASTTNIGAATGNYVNITGTTTITAFDTVQAGTRRILNFNSALTLTYNAVSLILPSSANIVTAGGDTATFVSLGAGNWICISYQRRDGTSLTGSSSTTYQRLTAVSGTQDGANKVFTIANTPLTGSLQFYLNGQLMNFGSSNDIVLSGGTTVTFQAGVTAPAATDTLLAYATY